MKQTPLIRKTPLLRTKPIRRQSTKARRTADIRRKQRPEERPMCEWPMGCGDLADDWNERLLRSRGGSATDPANRQWLCRTHHDYFHAHPKEMHELGLMPHAWEATNV